MKSSCNTLSNLKTHPQNQPIQPNSLQHIKSVTDFRKYRKNQEDVDIKGKVIHKEKMDKKENDSLRYCKSNPNFLTVANNYIKLDKNTLQNYQEIVNKLQYNLHKQGKQTKNNTIQISKKKPILTIETSTPDLSSKKPKFMRKKNDIKQQTLASPLGSSNSLINLNDSFRSMGDLLQENSTLKKKLLEYQSKIQQLNYKLYELKPNVYMQKLRILEKNVKEYQLKLKVKDKEIEELKNMVLVSDQEKNQITKKLQDIISEQEVFKGSSCHFNLDDSGIGMDMLSTAEYIESLTDLQEELQQRKAQIYDLNKTVEQLKMKHHFAELRNEENLRRLSTEWENKYKRLLNMYKTLKSNRSDNYCMKKPKTKTQYIQYEKQELFDLSISAQQSQLQLF